jgi:hypothetical protein
MTSRYAHIHDATMKDKLSEYLKGTLIDVSAKWLQRMGPTTRPICSGSLAASWLKL